MDGGIETWNTNMMLVPMMWQLWVLDMQGLKRGLQVPVLDVRL